MPWMQEKIVDYTGWEVECRTYNRWFVGSNLTSGCCVPMPTQHAIPLGSVNEYQRKLWE